MIRTYVDADVLIAAAKGTEELSEKAMAILEDEAREFVASIFLRMETTAPSTFNNYPDQVAFYEEYFRSVVEWVQISDQLINNAYNECQNSGVPAFDALHIAAAAATGAQEFITAEKPTRPIHRAKLVKVVSIRP